jgi:ABC-type phosphate transport system permease subunit
MLFFKIIIIIIIVLLIVFTLLNISLILSNSCEIFQNKNVLNKKSLIQNNFINNNELHKSKYYGLKSGKYEKSLIGKIKDYTYNYKKL